MRPTDVLATLLGLLLPWTAAANEPFLFGVVGDAPYNLEERAAFVRLLDQMKFQPFAFVVHIGDLKWGSGDCDDATYRDRLKLFDTSLHPFVYLPGDNDWADCDRFLAGRRDPEERLAFLRRTFFAQPESLGLQRIPLERQPADETGCCPENARWWRNEVLFVSAHVVGPNNRYGPGPEPLPEFVVRNRATLQWLAESFAQAREREAKAAVVFVHANLRLESPASRGPGFAAFVAALREAVDGFGKPVLLVHGDTHSFRFDMPWAKRYGNTPAGRMLRLETYGSPTVQYIGVVVQPGQTQPFGLFQPGR